MLGPEQSYSNYSYPCTIPNFVSQSFTNYILLPNTPNKHYELGMRSFSLSMAKSDISDDCDEVDLGLQECPSAELDCTSGLLAHVDSPIPCLSLSRHSLC